MTHRLPSISGPQKYLLVDDHAGFRNTVRDFLPGSPVELIECADGSAAVDLFASHQPDWTLMDIEMPGMDGLQATRSIRSHFPEARILVLTQHDSPDLREEARAAGACAFVLKDRLRDLPEVIDALSQAPCPDGNRDSQS